MKVRYGDDDDELNKGQIDQRSQITWSCRSRVFRFFLAAFSALYPLELILLRMAYVLLDRVFLVESLLFGQYNAISSFDSFRVIDLLLRRFDLQARAGKGKVKIGVQVKRGRER